MRMTVILSILAVPAAAHAMQECRASLWDGAVIVSGAIVVGLVLDRYELFLGPGHRGGGDRTAVAEDPRESFAFRCGKALNRVWHRLRRRA